MLRQGKAMTEHHENQGGAAPLWRRMLARLRQLNRERLQRRHRVRVARPPAPLSHAEWIDRFDRIEGENLEALERRLQVLPARPLLSLVMPVYNPDLRWLDEAIASVRRQLYPNWELCIADDASTDARVLPRLHEHARRDPRIRIVAREINGHISACSNTALALVRGSHVGWIDQDDLLREHALLLMAEAIGHWPQAQVLYSDEDKNDAAGVRRQAGMHARMINRLVEELFPGQTFDRSRLKEVLGHSPLEVIAGVLLGLFTALTVWAAAQ